MPESDSRLNREQKAHLPLGEAVNKRHEFGEKGVGEVISKSDIPENYTPEKMQVVFNQKELEFLKKAEKND
jgi:hypothetical protein